MKIQIETPVLMALLDVWTSLICIYFVKPFEIDLWAYISQAQLFLLGERDYEKLVGRTGPVAYPATHIYLYSFFSVLTNHFKGFWFDLTLKSPPPVKIENLNEGSIKPNYMM